MHPQSRPSPGRAAAWGSGLIVMLADTDAGTVVTSAQAGALWGYRLLPLVLLLVVPLYLVQEMAVRLGVGTGRGFGDLVRRRFGRPGAALALGALVFAVLGSLVTELTGVAAVGDLYGVSRALTLPAAVLALFALAGTDRHRRVERIAIAVGLFELAFFAVAWRAQPSFATLAREVGNMPFGDREFLYLAAAIIGAAFSPWMIVYQQAATARKALGLAHLRAARLDTAFGAALAQGVASAILIAAAATLGSGRTAGGLGSVGEISAALTPLLGATLGRAVFGVGVLGASLVAAIVCALALAWGMDEIAGRGAVLGGRGCAATRLHPLYAVIVLGAALLVGTASDLVRLAVAAQVLNTALLPLSVGLLGALALTELSRGLRPRGMALWLFAIAGLVVCGAGLLSGMAGVWP